MVTWIRRSAYAVLALVILADVAVCAGVWLTRDPVPKPLSGGRIFEASRPAVVLIQTDYEVGTQLPGVTVPADREKQIENKITAEVESGQVALTNAAIQQAWVDIVAADPDSYLAADPSKPTTDSYGLVSSGSGFYVTENGYVVTAAHVVAASKDDLRGEILTLDKSSSAVADQRDQLQADLRRDTGLSFSSDQLDHLTAWFAGFEAKNLQITSVSSKLYLGTGASVVAGSALEAAGTRAEIITSDPPFPGRDVALLKAAVDHVPALPLATGEPRIPEPAYVVGYPRTVYLDEQASTEATVPVKLAAGQTTGRDPHRDFTAYGTDAVVTHGDSGGPVLDGSGGVAGLVSYGSGTSGEGYFIPASAIRENLARAGVHPAAGSLTPTYYAALREADARHYREALPMLAAIHSAAPTDAYASDELATVQAAILGGQDRTPLPVLDYVPAASWATAAGLGLAVLLLIAANLARLLRSQRPEPAVASASVS